MSTSNTNNNSAEIIVKGSVQERRLEEENYPDPNTLPLPAQEQRIVDVTLSELVPGRYVSTTARRSIGKEFSSAYDFLLSYANPFG